MHVRAKTVRHRDKTYAYLQLVEARLEAGGNRQRVMATLGRLDQIAASGQLDRLIAGLARFSAHLRVVSGARLRRGARKAGGQRWCLVGCGSARDFQAFWSGSRRIAGLASTSSG